MFNFNKMFEQNIENITLEFKMALEYENIKKIIQKLYKEFESINYMYKLKLKTPVINLFESDTLWGQFDCSTYEIKISKELIYKYDWLTVINILKHEIAHIICHNKSIKPHDNIFYDICEQLGLAPNFRKASILLKKDIINWKNVKYEDKTFNILLKIEKLVAMAESTNEHEAAVALKRIQELQEKYNIEELKNQKNKDVYELIICEQKKKMNRNQSIIISILSTFFYVKIIIIKLFDAKLTTDFCAIHFFGKQENVLIAEYLYYFLIKKIESLWLSFKMGNATLSLKDKSSYQQGVLYGLFDKLNITNKKSTINNEEKSLMKISDIEVENYVKKVYPKLSTLYKKSLSNNENIYNKGYEEGKKLEINSAISKQSNVLLLK